MAGGTENRQQSTKGCDDDDDDNDDDGDGDGDGDGGEGRRWRQ